MELASLTRLRAGSAALFEARLDETKALAEQTMRTVRDIAVGLRPSSLDDLGLAPALEWQAREFSRRSGTPVRVETQGEADNLPERHRTCIYRIVQEALTNCAKHSQASNVRIRLHARDRTLALTVEDDGVGFETAGPVRRGLGLIGIEERVRELGGTVSIHSGPGEVMRLNASLPLPHERVV